MKTILFALFLLATTRAAPQQHAFNNFDAARQTNGGFNRDASKYLPPDAAQAEPIVHKQFFLISAQDDAANAEKSKHLVLGRPQKNYRVIFIKAPPSENANTKFSAEFAPQEEKTVIYVLTKKDNELNANDIATPEPAPASKPEVFFIKYKTDEEASVAQKEIQDQYDLLGGTSEFSDEGTAPLASVVGSLDGSASDHVADHRPAQAPVLKGSAVLSPYLPPTFRH